MDGGIKCTLSKFVYDTKTCGVVYTLEGKDTTWRDLDSLERKVFVNNMQFNKAKCKDLHLDQGTPRYVYRLGNSWIEDDCVEKGGQKESCRGALYVVLE